MRKVLLLSLGFLPGVLFAQNQNLTIGKLNPSVKVKMKAMSSIVQDVPSHAKASSGARLGVPPSAVGKVIGKTFYDLQSNASVQRRVNHYSTGKTSCTWTISPDSVGTTFPNRGTGYNNFNGTAWGPIPTKRQEATIRTGWPALVVNGSNDEVIICHGVNTAGTTYYDHQLTNSSIGSTTWTENNVTTNTTNIWTRTAASGNYIYLIDCNQDTNYVHAGCTTKQPVTYSRSTDGGATWTTDHILIPGFPCNRYFRCGGDEYFVDAKDSFVAIVIAGTGKDVTLFKSHDYGVNFTKIVADSFPIAAYQGGATGAITDSILTNDGNVTCLIDNGGMVHVWWGTEWIKGDPTASESFSFYPGLSSGLRYWNEYSKQQEDIDNALYSLHLCPTVHPGDTVFQLGTGYNLNAANAMDAIYRSGLTSMPQAGIDASGNIYVTYSEVISGDWTGTNNSNGTPANQNYRDLFMLYLKPNGANYDSAFATTSANTWSFPVNITKSPGFEDVYPSMARNVDTAAYITWQEDIEPGTNLTNADPITTNYIKFLSLNTANFRNDAASSSNICQLAALAAPVPKFDTASNCSTNTWQFTDQSTNNPNTWSWTFGANALPSSSTLQNPTVQFTTTGSRVVRLVASNQVGGTTNSFAMTINNKCGASGIQGVLNQNNLSIFPNPTTGKLSVVFNNFEASKLNISIENMLGQQIAMAQNQAVANGSTFTFDLSNNASGVYFIKFQTPEGTHTEKFVISK